MTVPTVAAKKDYEAGPQRTDDGKVKWSETSVSMMRALRIRTLFMMSELDLKELSPLEKKWAFTEYDHIDKCPHCTLCGSISLLGVLMCSSRSHVSRVVIVPVLPTEIVFYSYFGVVFVLFVHEYMFGLFGIEYSCTA